MDRRDGQRTRRASWLTADKILNPLAESGRYVALLDLDGLYAELYR